MTVLDTNRVLSFFSEHLSRKSPQPLRSALQHGDFDTFWQLWTPRVRDRVKRLGLETLRERLDWGVLTQPSKTAHTGATEPFSPGEPFEATCAFYADLLDAALHIDTMDAAIFVEQLQNAFVLMNDALALETDAPERQLVLGEMALLFGLLYPELAPFGRCAERARRVMNDSIRTNFDTVGFPPVERLAAFRPLLASYTRTLELAERLDVPLLSTGAQKRLEWTALALCRLTGFDGRLAFEPASGQVGKISVQSARALLDFFTELFRFDRDPTDRAAAAATAARIAVLAGEKGKAEQWRAESGDSDSVTAPWLVSRNSTLAVLRTGWEPETPTLVAAVDAKESQAISPEKKRLERTDGSIRTECRIGGRTIFSGVWDLTVRLGGTTLQAAGDWESVCEEASSQRLYWELALPLERDFRVERQFLLVPNEGIALLADSVIGPDGDRLDSGHGENRHRGRLEYESRLTLAPSLDFIMPTLPISHSISRLPAGNGGVSDRLTEKLKWNRYSFDAEGREVLGCFGEPGRPFVRMFPLALSEWKHDSSKGDFLIENGTAILTAIANSAVNATNGVENDAENSAANGQALYAAYCFDFDRKRLARPFTWRRLTVGRNREKTPDSEAVGFRYQAGNGHYLIYKSLADPVPRSVLGEHFDQEFVFARFIPDGKTEPILEIENGKWKMEN